MKLLLDLPLSYPAEEQINYRDPLLLFGSCFSENIGSILQKNRFRVAVNPNGILYNPVTISDCIYRLVQEKLYSENDFVPVDGLWYSWYHHGVFAAQNKDLLLHQINHRLQEAIVFLKSAKVIFITFGTAYYWRHKKLDIRVANCHKIPGNQFSKLFFSTNEICDTWISLLTLLRKINPNLKFVFTVSPVRYIRDGIIENNKSKATLISAVHQICEHSNAIYFPAYEFINDVLRDYRFFKEDLVHPNQQAIRFVWDKFSSTLLDEDTRQMLSDMNNYNSLAGHQPLHSDFQESHLNKLNVLFRQLQEKYPDVNWANE